MKSDIMIMVPVFNESLDINTIKTKETATDIITSSVMKNIVPELHKTFLKDISYYKIDYTTFLYKEQYIKCPVYLFFDRQSNIGVVHIYIKDSEVDGSVIAHLIDNNDICLQEGDKTLNCEEYIKSLSLIQCGDLRCLYNMTPDTSINKIKDIISGGTSQRMNMNDKEYDRIKPEIITVFEDWPIYVGRKEVIQLNKSHSFLENYNDWIIYQVSIAIMQFTAVYKANRDIEKELMYKHSIDEKQSLKILEEFGICNNLYSCNMYSHARSKQVAEKLRDIFDTDERFNLYKDNKDLLFDIAELRNTIEDKKQNDLLLIFTVVVGVAGFLDLFADWMEKGPLLDRVISIPSIITLLWCVWMFWRMKKGK